MGFVSDNFLGGAERRAGRMQANAARRAQDLVQQNTMQALQELRGQFPQAEQALMNAYGDQLGFLQTGQERALGQLFGYGQQGLNALSGGEQQARQDIMSGYDRATANLSPFAAGGNQAYQQQLAFSGALGPEAQQRAYDSFVESPGQQYLQEQGERAVMRNAAAAGGMGGQVLQELQRQGQGLAQQDFGNYFNRLAGTAQQGQQAAGQLAGYGAQRANTLANLASQGAANRANLLSSLGSGASGLTSQFANLLSSAASTRGTGLANLRSQLGTSLANALIGQGSQLAGLEQDYGAAQAQGLLDQTAQRRAFANRAHMMSMDPQVMGQSAMSPGGLSFLTSIFSDKNIKEDIHTITGLEAFNKVMRMDIKAWKYKPEMKIDNKTHYGPMAQDAPDIITDNTKKLINVHDELMLVSKALQYARKNRNDLNKLLDKVA